MIDRESHEESRDESTTSPEQQPALTAEEFNPRHPRWHESPSDAADSTESSDEPLSPESQEATTRYLVQWNGLVSTTNWEKGRIINRWRDELQAAGATASQTSDETWSREVGNVSPQHVGRLRRVHQRFSEVRESYEGLYWSHFNAALDWDDAEMWLEGGVQNGWSVSQMRNARWEAQGAPADQKPKDQDILVGQIDEDSLPTRLDSKSANRESEREFDGDSPTGPNLDEHSDFGEEASAAIEFPGSEDISTEGALALVEGDGGPAVRPFENLPEMPDDMAEAFEAFKLSIVRHKMAGWSEISREDTVAVLDALRQLALVPSPQTAS